LFLFKKRPKPQENDTFLDDFLRKFTFSTNSRATGTLLFWVSFEKRNEEEGKGFKNHAAYAAVDRHLLYIYAMRLSPLATFV
jgi:hypothetical protein